MDITFNVVELYENHSISIMKYAKEFPHLTLIVHNDIETYKNTLLKDVVISRSSREISIDTDT